MGISATPHFRVDFYRGFPVEKKSGSFTQRFSLKAECFESGDGCVPGFVRASGRGPGNARPCVRQRCGPLPAMHRDALGSAPRDDASRGSSGQGRNRRACAARSSHDRPILASYPLHSPASRRLLAPLSDFRCALDTARAHRIGKTTRRRILTGPTAIAERRPHSSEKRMLRQFPPAAGSPHFPAIIRRRSCRSIATSFLAFSPSSY